MGVDDAGQIFVGGGVGGGYSGDRYTVSFYLKDGSVVFIEIRGDILLHSEID